jgi:hypothetical protein
MRGEIPYGDEFPVRSEQAAHERLEIGPEVTPAFLSDAEVQVEAVDIRVFEVNRGRAAA